VGRFVKVLNHFTRDYFGDRSGLIFIMKWGTWGVLFMFGYGKKWFNFTRAPTLGWKWVFGDRQLD
jgi:hypothetical protein